MPPMGLANQTEVGPGAESDDRVRLQGSGVPKLTPPSGRSRRLVLGPGDRVTLERWARSRTLAARLVLRARIVASLSEGQSVAVTAVRLRTTRATVRLWRHRYVTEGLESLTRDRAGRGRKPLPTRDTIVCGESHESHGPIRALARSLEVSPSTVSRWRRARRDRQGS